MNPLRFLRTNRHGGYIVFGALLLLLSVVGFSATDLPFIFIAFVPPLLAVWSTLILHGARQSRAHETGTPPEPLSVLEALRLIGAALLLGLLIGGALLYSGLH